MTASSGASSTDNLYQRVATESLTPSAAGSMDHLAMPPIRPVPTGGNPADKAGGSSAGASSASSMQESNDLEKSQEILMVDDGVKLPVFGIIWRVVAVITLLYMFICSLDLLSNSFRLLGGETAGKVFSDNKAINNPVGGLMIGVLVTVLVQSSSTSSSIVVAMVASSILTVPTAVPLIMGANIGTSVTNTIVALSQIQDGDMFERSFAAATVHDMFNVLTVICLLPMEVMTGFLVYLSDKMVNVLNLPYTTAGEVEFLSRVTDPLTDRVVLVDKSVISQIAQGVSLKPGQQLLQKFCDDAPAVVSHTLDNATESLSNSTEGLVNNADREHCTALFNMINWSDSAAGAVLLVLSLTILFTCLVCLVKILQSIFQGHISKVINKTVNADFPGRFAFLTGYVAICIGVVMTILVQSSSIFTSTLTPLVGLNIITLERAFPLTLGSNIGTTITSILAALASEGNNFRYALQISFCHLLFNVIGICIWYPIEFFRKVPIACARQLGKTTNKYRWFSFTYILFMFFVLPATVFGLSYAGPIYILTFIIIVAVISISVFSLKLLQHCIPDKLPQKLKNFKFLPIYLRSLKPYDTFLTGWYTKLKTKQIERIRRVTESSQGLTQDDELEKKRDGKSKKRRQQQQGKGKFSTNIAANYDIERGQEADETYNGLDGVKAVKTDQLIQDVDIDKLKKVFNYETTL